MKPIKFYVAGGMSGYPDYNFPEFDRVCQAIRRAGHIALGPQELDRLCGYDECYLREHTVTEEEIRKLLLRDLMLISQEATAICVLSGWARSKGAVAEVAFAMRLKLPIYDDTLQPINVILGVESWTQP